MEELIPIIAIVFGTALTFFIFGGFFSLAKTWINRKSADSQIDPQFFRALSEFKRSTERRIAHLESIIANTEELDAPVKEPPSIQIEEKSVRQSPEAQQKSGGNLRNMLEE